MLKALFLIEEKCGNFSRNACVWKVTWCPVTLLSIGLTLSASVLHSNCYYTVVGGVFLSTLILVEQSEVDLATLAKVIRTSNTTCTN